MPDFVPVSGSIEVRITGQHVGGKKMYNIIHVDCGSPLPTPAEVQAVAEEVAVWCINSYKALYHSDIAVVNVRARSNAQEPGPVWNEIVASAVGTVTGDMLSMDSTLCVNMLTGTTGQSRRGKFYVFTAGEGVWQGGLYTSVYYGAASLSLTTLMDQLTLAGFALAVESRRTLSLWQVQTFQPQPVPSKLASRKANRGI